jgi:MoaA/NifB/PqqE/SkfB family radical SAM enzyme
MTGGCVAGGKYFCSIDAKGNVESCFFTKKTDTNIRENTLLEALQAPLFMKYHGEEVPCEAGM